MKIMVIDTETGGRDPDQHSVLSVAAIAGDIDTGKISESFSCLVKLPNYNVTSDAFNIHGILPEQCQREGKTPEEIQIALSDLWVNNRCVIIGGHNVDFDKRMLSKQIYKCSLSEFDANFGYKVIDSNVISLLFLGIDGLKEGFTLKQMCKAWNIDMSEHGGAKFHNALFDTVASFKLLSKFRSIIGQNEKLMKELQA